MRVRNCPHFLREVRMKQKDLYIDVETTGTLPLCHGVIQIAAIAVIDGKVKGVFNEHLRPFKAD